jgi:hypothetical protein
MAYYDIVNNETVSSTLKGNGSFWTYVKAQNANVFTLRVQYKF